MESHLRQLERLILQLLLRLVAEVDAASEVSHHKSQLVAEVHDEEVPGVQVSVRDVVPVKVLQARERLHQPLKSQAGAFGPGPFHLRNSSIFLLLTKIIIV